MADAKRTCSFDGCTRAHYAHGFCKAHYLQLSRGRSLRPLGPSYASAPAVERVLRRAEPSGDCLLWPGSVDTDGYGSIRVDGKLAGTHRVVWIATHGTAAPGMEVDHRCRNRRCVKIGHLQLVTKKLNMENRAGARVDSTSGIRGVLKHGSRWRVRVQHDGRNYSGGVFTSIEAAERAAIALRNRLFTNNLADLR